MSVPPFGSIEMIRGQALDIEVTVPGEADLTGATVEFGLALSPKHPYVETLSTTKAGQVITAEITGAQSSGLKCSRYFYSCWIVISGDPTPVARGYLTLLPDSYNR